MTYPITDLASSQLGDYACNWDDDNDYGRSHRRHVLSWIRRVARGQTPVENLHPDAREFFETVRAKRFDWEYDEETEEENSLDIDWGGVVIYSKAGVESIRALEFEDDADVARFILAEFGP